MEKIQNTAAGRGHVRAVFSERCRGHAVPLDLVRVHLRAVGRMALRGRVAAAFAGYLVTDSDDDELRRLEIYGRKYQTKAAALSEVRGRHRPALDRLAATGRGPWPFDLHSSAVDSGHGCLDAPGYLAAGGMRAYRSEYSGDIVRAPVLAVRS